MPEFVELPVNYQIPLRRMYVEKFPIRSPVKTADALKKLLQGKTICDVGCAKGDMVLKFATRAERAFGINIDKEEAQLARSRGAEVIVGDALTMDIPPADFYFFYWDGSVGSPFIERMMNEHPGPFTILTSGCEGRWWQQKYIDDWNPSTVYTFRYKEESTCDEKLAPAEGVWWIVAIEKPAEE